MGFDVFARLRHLRGDPVRDLPSAGGQQPRGVSFICRSLQLSHHADEMDEPETDQSEDDERECDGCRYPWPGFCHDPNVDPKA